MDLQHSAQVNTYYRFCIFSKQLTFVFQVLDLKPHQMDWVLRHMGHSLDVHKIYYRATSDVIERTQIAKILLLQDADRFSEFSNSSLDDIQLSGIPIKFNSLIHNDRKELFNQWKAIHLSMKYFHLPLTTVGSNLTIGVKYFI